jgi:hypothetical protein
MAGLASNSRHRSLLNQPPHEQGQSAIYYHSNPASRQAKTLYPLPAKRKIPPTEALSVEVACLDRLRGHVFDPIEDAALPYPPSYSDKGFMLISDSKWSPFEDTEEEMHPTLTYYDHRDPPDFVKAKLSKTFKAKSGTCDTCQTNFTNGVLLHINGEVHQKYIEGSALTMVGRIYRLLPPYAYFYTSDILKVSQCV